MEKLYLKIFFLRISPLVIHENLNNLFHTVQLTVFLNQGSGEPRGYFEECKGSARFFRINFGKENSYFSQTGKRRPIML